jgi:hypothetical protein
MEHYLKIAAVCVITMFVVNRVPIIKSIVSA